jgi:hypothetical protein
MQAPGGQARATGKHVGRPRGEHPERERVLRRRDQGRSWRQVALALGCSVWAARMAAS